MDDTYNDLYPLQLKDPEIPVQEDCSNDTVPAGTTNMEGKKKVLVPELITMTKVLFDRYRLDMYTYLNNCLHTGGLAAIVGKPIKTRVINHEICTFPGVTYWRIDRANFLADVTVELKLQTSTGLVDWRGCLTCWCGFDDTFSCTNGTRLQKHKKGPATTEKTYDWEVTVHWQCGLSTTVPLPMDKNQTEEPTHVAELYETYLNRVDSGEYIPARPKSIFEKQLVAQKRVTKIGGKDDHKKD